MSSETHIDFNNCQIGRIPVVGLYGISGSGKTFVLEALKRALGTDHILVEGSEVISKLVDGGLQGFHGLEENQKEAVRQLALQTIQADCLNDRKVGVVAGHFMLWLGAEGVGSSVWTQQDASTYTHIIYLSPPAETIHHRRCHDAAKPRPEVTIDKLRQWQSEEERQLRMTCYRSGIIYTSVREDSPLAQVTSLLELFLHRGQESHRREVEKQLDHFIAPAAKNLVSALVLDADKTLSPADSGHLFWEHVHSQELFGTQGDYLKGIFGGPLGYTSAAFLQMALLYEELLTLNVFDDVCTDVAERISLYPDVAALLLRLRRDGKTGILIVTCGLRRVWERVLDRHGLLDSVKVIGSGPIRDAHVITGRVKANLVAHLQRYYHLHVAAVGDGVLDLEMFAQADRAVVIVGDQKTRSQRMEKELAAAITGGRVSASQALLSAARSPRLDTGVLPLIELNASEFDAHILRGLPFPLLNTIDLTETRIAQILATPMRDSSNKGPALRNAHWQTGRYLAQTTLPNLLGVEEYMIRHVQGHNVSGHRIAQQNKALIVALMRGGEPMAMGISEVLPSASFLHAKKPEDVTGEILEGTSIVILADSVVNSGQTVADFIGHLTSLKPTMRIIVMAGVVQVEATARIEGLCTTRQSRRVDLVTLRVSHNKFPGRGGTDTGNRLFLTETLK
ncbi:hypothetical protein A1O7_06734 [Cladophialophora yegresii CBS 114405]|uniref:Phosphoribosyltransferase domain-containing protein n=1 Tax=Cladophialophora yegresii CBS 114405 TaxID=1182544 RepID=W9VVZ2_9EURO|nr:uncharacterized protein A1O7_06734 [Cladophialophora yegresii CBS 114405]EXJ56391.1 hypothetical protein A1O7_06734 [Cladophialophora yegresii CBS 114405]